MMNISNISTALTATLKESDLQNVTAEWSETFLDTFIAEGVLKEIPIISTIIGLGKTGIKINDMLFVKKLMYFITNIDDISVEERNKLISEIDYSNEFRVKVGEKLLYIIDKCDDYEKAEINAVLFNCVLSYQISYEDYLRCSLIIEKCVVNELKWFVKSTTNNYEMRNSAELFNWGLLEFAPLDLKIQEKRNGGKGYEITDKQLKLQLSATGEIIRTHLKNYLQKQLKDLKLTKMDFSNLEKYISSLATKDDNERNREKLNANLLDVICEVCNNYVLNEVERKTIFAYIMTIMGKFTIKYVTRDVEIKCKDEINKGNEFNLQIWMKFSNEFITEHELTDFRGNRL